MRLRAAARPGRARLIQGAGPGRYAIGSDRHPPATRRLARDVEAQFGTYSGGRGAGCGRGRCVPAPAVHRCSRPAAGGQSTLDSAPAAAARAGLQ